MGKTWTDFNPSFMLLDVGFWTGVWPVRISALQSLKGSDNNYFTGPLKGLNGLNVMRGKVLSTQTTYGNQ